MKTETLAEYGRQYGLSTLVETGLDGGRGSGMGAGFRRYIAIDIDPENVRLARAAGYDAICGDSGELLLDVLAGLDAPAVLWLDAHGVDCNTPAAPDGWPGWETMPLLRELEAAAAWRHGPASVVLIDDMPLMAHWIYIGGSDLDGFLDSLPVQWTREFRDGILRLTP